MTDKQPNECVWEPDALRETPGCRDDVWTEDRTDQWKFCPYCGKPIKVANNG